MILELGQFTVRLIGKSCFLENLFPRWNNTKIVENEPIDAVLRIEEAPYIYSDPANTGWTVGYICGKRSLVYTDGRKALFALQCEALRNDVVVLVNEAATHNLRIGVQFGVLLALCEKSFGLHGVTLLCGNEIVILSAPSGTGKTTLAHLLETYCDALMINGDFALLTPTADGMIFEPTPFCGSSGRCLNHRVKVNRVIFLEQSKTNEWKNLTGREALKRFMSNIFVPIWDEKMTLVMKRNVMRCISVVPIHSFAFAPTREAAEMLFSHLDHYED